MASYAARLRDKETHCEIGNTYNEQTGDKTKKTGRKNEKKTTDVDSSTSSDDEYFIQALRTGSRPRLFNA